MKKYLLYVLTLFFINNVSAKIAKSTSPVLTGTLVSGNSKLLCFASPIDALLGTTTPGTQGYWVQPTGNNLDLLKNKLASYDILKSTAKIILRVKDLGKLTEANLCLPNDFSFNLTIGYKKMNTAGVYDANVNTINLNVTYDKNKGLTYKSMDVFQIEDVSLISCMITGVGSLSPIDPRNFLEVSTEIEYEYLVKESFLNSMASELGVSYTVPELYIVPTDDKFNLRGGLNGVFAFYPAKSYLSDFSNWIDSVEFQWTVSDTVFFKYNSSLAKVELKKVTTLSTDFNPNFKEYVLSVVVPFSNSANYHYTMSNIFESGVVSFRARFMGKLAVKENNVIVGQKNVFLPWSDYAYGTSIYNANSTAHDYIGYSISFLIDTYKKDFNWIYSCTYAEDGKKKESINYFDGTLKSRQQITTSNTDNFALVKETIYDYQGRPAIEVLPVPVNTTSLSYIPNFNQVEGTNKKYSAENFDLNVIGSACNPVTMGMSANSGAAKYYSASNTWANAADINNRHNFIPSSLASGNSYFPFVQTVYTPDNTGRVSLTTQPGGLFKRGSNKETKYIYGRPEQEELDRLFGTEIGFAEHYTKEAVKDANGQYSISVKDLSGKVVFTALAGGNSEQTTALPSASGSLTIDVDLLKHSQSPIDDGFLLTSPLTVMKTADFYFQYSLDAANYSKLCGSTTYCLDCVYDLELSITNECGEEQLIPNKNASTVKGPIVRKIGPSSSKIDNVCNPDDSKYDSKTDGNLDNNSINWFSEPLTSTDNKYIRVNLAEGKYFITRKIKVNDQAREDYLREVVAKTTCKTLTQFETEELNKMDLDQCKPCQDYNNVKKTGGDTRTKYIDALYKKRITDKGMQLAPASAVTAYRANLGVEYDSLIRYCGIQFDPCAVYKNTFRQDVMPNGLYGELTTRNTTTNTRFSVFRTLLGNGKEYYTALAAFNAEELSNLSKLKTDADIPKYWKPEYADKLMPLHPEYYQLRACLDLAESRVFDVEMSAVTDYNEAKNWNYMEPIGIVATNNKDRFSVNINGSSITLKTTNSLFQQFTADVNTNALPVLGLSGNFSAKSITALPLIKMAAFSAFCQSSTTNTTTINNCINNAIANINNCDYKAKNLFWNTYKGLYFAIKSNKYNTYINSFIDPLLNTKYPANTFTSSFANTTYLQVYNNLDNQNIRFPKFNTSGNLTNDVNTKKTENIAKQTENCKTNCENMADGWIMKLNSCFFGITGENALIEAKRALKTALVNVCKEGCDEKNPMGASSVKPGSLNPDKSFEDVLIRLGYAYSKECNADLIKFPKPYDANGSSADAKNNPLANITDYCAEGINPCILYGNCNPTITNPNTACNILNVANNANLPKLLNSVDTMTCATGNCISCSKMRELYQEYFNKTDEFTTNNTLTSFINKKLGFNLTEIDYKKFMGVCIGIDTASGFKDYSAEFRQAYLIYKPTPTSYTFASLDNNIWEIGNTSLEENNTLNKPKFESKYRPFLYQTVLTELPILTVSLGNQIFEIPKKNLEFEKLETASKVTCAGFSTGSIPGDCGSNFITKIRAGSFWNNNLSLRQNADNAFDNISSFMDSYYAHHYWNDYYDPFHSGYCPGLHSEWRKKLCDCGVVSRKKCAGGGYGSYSACEYIEEDIQTFFPNKVYRLYMTTANIPVNQGELIKFYNYVQTQPYATSFVKLDESNINFENLRLWLGDILCNCKIDSSYCANELLKCSQSSVNTGVCYLPNGKSLGLQSLFQEIVKNNNNRVKTLAVSQFVLNNRLKGSNLAYPLGCTNLSSLFGVDLATLYSAPRNGVKTELTYSVLKTYTVSSYRHLVAEFSLSDILGWPGVSPIDVRKKVHLSMLTGGYSFDFNDIVEINELFPVYIPGHNIATNRFVIRAKTLVVVNGVTNYKTVLINGYFEDAITTTVNCNVKCAKLCRKPEVAVEPCEQVLRNSAKAIAFYKYNEQIKNIIEEERINYTNKCLEALKTTEKFRKVYQDQQYHYTLYYYDAAGNLLKTVPPQGVKPFSNKTDLTALKTGRQTDYTNFLNKSTAVVTGMPLTTHFKVTHYRYNTLNQLVWQQTPDAGISQFAYDAFGRLAISQNANQRARKTSTTEGPYSYTLYDKLGRITEVGELGDGVMQNPFTQTAGFETFGYLAYTSSNKSQVTQTFYDYNPDISDPVLNNNNRGRVAKVAYFASLGASPSHSISYDYDIRGNVKKIKRYTQSLEVLNQAEKTVDYDFDVISGKVENVYYQNNKADQYVHHYKYDAENRLIESYSSPRKELINTNYKNNTDILDKMGLDAAYSYYYHGPLSRTELGEAKVQGLDYAYTLQGWLKGVNSFNLNPAFDIGKDNHTTGQNTTVPKDEMGFILNYYNNDYSQINTTTNAFHSSLNTTSTGFGDYPRQLFNGNISSMITAIRQLFNTSGNNGLVSAYKYDQINRIRAAQYYRISSANTSVSSTTEWNNLLIYDSDGNIVKQDRNGAGSVINMDNLTYYYKGYYKASSTATTETKFHYTYDANGNLVSAGPTPTSTNFVRYTNQLDYVDDNTTFNNNYSDDIDDQSVNNYNYDQIGNLISDVKEGITSIEWTLYGKIKRINFTNKPTIEFEYTPDGHRAVKIVYGTPTIYTYYVRDAQGNIMATYERRIEKIMNFEGLTYTQINNKIREKQSAYKFGEFIGGLHYTQNNLLNGLRGQITTPAQEDNYVGNLGVPMFLVDSRNSATALSVINSYDNWQILQSARIYWQTSNGFLLARQLQLRNNLNPSMQNLQNTIIQIPGLLRFWINEMYLRDNARYVQFMNLLGLPNGSDFETDYSNIPPLIENEGTQVIFDALKESVAFDRFEEGTPSNIILNRLLTFDDNFRSLLFSSFPDYLSLFLDPSLTTPSLSNFKLDIAQMCNSLYFFNIRLIMDKTIAIYGAANFIDWFKLNEPQRFCTIGAFINPEYVASYQTANQAVLYPNNPGVNNSFKQNYFAQITNYFGQSTTDILLNEFLQLSNLSLDKLTVSEFHIYGSSRLGVYHADMLLASRTVNTDGTSTPLSDATLNVNYYSQIRGAKYYEMSNHLGNVLATVSDKKIFNCKRPELVNNLAHYINAYPINSSTTISGSSGKLSVNGNGLIGFDGAFMQKSVIGKTYKVTFDLTITGPLNVSLNTYSTPTATGGLGALVNSTTFNTSGSKTFTFVANSELVSFRFFANHNTGSSNGFAVWGFIVSEEGVNSYDAEVISAQDYSPFGAPLASRTFQVENAAVTKPIYKDFFVGGTDGWKAFPLGTTISLYYNNLRINTTTATGLSGISKEFLTESGKLYRIVMRNNIARTPKMTVKDILNNKELVTTNTQVGLNYLTFRATSHKTEISLYLSSTIGTFLLTNFTLEEVEEKNAYRFGFNGKEKDDEVKGSGNSISFDARMYDPRLVRWLSMDALANKYPAVSPFVFALNTPIMAKDPDGNVVIFINGQHAGSGGTAAYWGGYDSKVKHKVGDWSARYVDGALGGWNNTAKGAATGAIAGRPLGWVGSISGAVLTVSTSTNVSLKVRMAAGEAQGMKDAADIIANLKDGETIKIVTHSMGTGFARGYVEGILKYAKENGLADKVNFEYELDVNAFQGGDLPAVPGIPTQNKTGGQDGGGNLIEALQGNSVPTVGPVPNAENTSTESDKDKGHNISKMSIDGIPKLGNGGKPASVEQGNNNQNKPN